MNNEEAIKRCNELTRLDKDLVLSYSYMNKETLQPYYIDAIKIAIEALEKQIPQKKHKYNGIRCVCGEQVAKNQDYCEYCGQRLLEWKEVEE